MVSSYIIFQIGLRRKTDWWLNFMQAAIVATPKPFITSIIQQKAKRKRKQERQEKTRI
jgi:hypothetical protein